ncbi:hypothetical protein [Nonomuraea sp. NEAU-A123]|uniref:hypothetical protein n=1 Tax=Nonomuraea sp. NEAU-A123 TaxID=2839649 RepID=UPI001BE4390A|nr:hypothetical protein [Nonomuraea sp. NEAU-A123]MBT2234267.1 hypothetical protein [Nonomuraea sp. NEAU-A123]
MTDLDAYHGLHLAAPRGNITLVDWYPWQPTSAVTRVRAYTCDCAPVVYELCVAGGHTYIRRCDWSTYPTSVMESERMTDRHAQDLWMRIMSGEAR